MVAAYAASASALVAVITVMVAQTEVLAGQVEQGFGRHPDVEIYRSQPGLGTILGARVLAEFGDDPDRYADARARKNYSGMSPITRASGTKRVVLARHARNRTTRRRPLPAGVRRPHQLTRRPRVTTTGTVPAAPPTTKPSAPSANRLVGILHGCLRHHTPYDENTAWPALNHQTSKPLDTLRPWDV